MKYTGSYELELVFKNKINLWVFPLCQNKFLVTVKDKEIFLSFNPHEILEEKQKDHLTVTAFVRRQSCCSYPLRRKKSGELACCIFSFPPAKQVRVIIRNSVFL